MAFITIDLGTTNSKVAIFSDAMKMIGSTSEKVSYLGQGPMVEFDAEQCFAGIVRCLGKLVQQLKQPVHQIVLTGQAESLVVLAANGKPLRRAISWLDMRSQAESEQLKQAFPENEAFQITGQPANTPTWPITKILWLKQHEKDIFQQAAHYLMLKDYILYRLTGVFCGEYSIYNFTYYFDLQKKTYWQDMLDYCGLRRDQLPDLKEPCTTVGPLLPELASLLGLNPAPQVNCGTLDHFAGMIGSGNIRPGILSESTGTVLSLATLVDRPILSGSRIPCHYGPFPGAYVLLPVCESGGVSLEWFRDKLTPEMNYRTIDDQITIRFRPGELVFLPYLTGTNSPDFDQTAKGVFYGLRLHHDKVDCALAVLEGVAYLLQRNLRTLGEYGIRTDQVITTGGGSKSAIWCQIKADMTGCTYVVPRQTEAALLGCALIGAVASGVFPDYPAAVKQAVTFKETYEPLPGNGYADQIRRYDALYEHLQPVFQLDEAIRTRSGHTAESVS